jgi:hypothetical protein
MRLLSFILIFILVKAKTNANDTLMIYAIHAADIQKINHQIDSAGRSTLQVLHIECGETLNHLDLSNLPELKSVHLSFPDSRQYLAQLADMRSVSDIYIEGAGVNCSSYFPDECYINPTDEKIDSLPLSMMNARNLKSLSINMANNEHNWNIVRSLSELECVELGSDSQRDRKFVISLSKWPKLKSLGLVLKSRYR